MSKSTAIRVRMDLAKPADLSDLSSVANATKAVEALKDEARELGFVLTAEVSAKVGSYDFGGEDEPEIMAEPEPDSAAQGLAKWFSFIANLMVWHRVIQTFEMNGLRAGLIHAAVAAIISVLLAAWLKGRQM